MSKMIQTGKMEAPKDDVAQEHFMILLDTLEMGLSIMNCPFWQTELLLKNNPLIGWEKNIWVLDPSAHGMAFLEVGMYRTTSSI
jgi:oxygen-independent coproporphyrinogen-3 oxidase